MSGPRRLAMLEDRRAALETCGYCPKLCRSACPVSEAEASEALIPWGKMTFTWYAARGDVEPDADFAALPWACTGCLACRDRCAHENPVAETLADARAAYRARGLLPERTRRLDAVLRAGRERAAAAARRLGDRGAGSALLVGCGYLARPGPEASDALHVARALLGPVEVLGGCCGLGSREAGDPERARAERLALERELDGRRLLIADAGCALELRSLGARTLVEAAAEHPERLRPALSAEGIFRWHDPCRLARGLGVVREPRVVLERALGAPVAEFERREGGSVCAGSGALLPFAMPRTARAIAADRLSEHDRLGGGTIVTGCASSLGWLRVQGARVVDIASVLSRSLSSG